MNSRNGQKQTTNSATKDFCFLSHLHDEKVLHKEHRHKHVIQKLLISGSILGIGQLISKPEVVFFVVLCIPFVCLVHDIYIFAEDFKVKRIGQFILHPTTRKMWDDDLVVWWEKFVDVRREKFALWGSLFYTALLTGVAGVMPLNLAIKWEPLHYIAYGLALGLAGASICTIFIIARLLDGKLGPKKEEQ